MTIETPPFTDPAPRLSEKEELRFEIGDLLIMSLQSTDPEVEKRLDAEATELLKRYEALLDCDRCGESREIEGDFSAYETTCDACAEREVIYG